MIDNSLQWVCIVFIVSLSVGERGTYVSVFAAKLGHHLFYLFRCKMFDPLTPLHVQASPHRVVGVVLEQGLKDSPPGVDEPVVDLMQRQARGRCDLLLLVL